MALVVEQCVSEGLYMGDRGAVGEVLAPCLQHVAPVEARRLRGQSFRPEQVGGDGAEARLAAGHGVPAEEAHDRLRVEAHVTRSVLPGAVKSVQIRVGGLGLTGLERGDLGCAC
ncbi:MAG: hypothetical protein ACRDUY_04120 [Nitriliruptorales bacterium]